MNDNEDEEPKNKRAKLGYGIKGKNDAIATPPDLLRTIEELFNDGKSMYDPCPLNYTVDAFHSDWGEINYVNPPFNQIQKFMKKALKEFHSKKRRSIFLITARLNSDYWEDYVWHDACELWIIKSRISFDKEKKNPLPIPLVLVNYSEFSSFQKPTHIEKNQFKFFVIPLKPKDDLPRNNSSN